MSDDSTNFPPLPATPSTNRHPLPSLGLFDPARLRLSQDFTSLAGVKGVLATIPVQKPSKETFIQVHPSDEYRISTRILELKSEGKFYLVDPSLWAELSNEATITPRILLTAMTRQNILFLWPIRLPGDDGNLDSWNRSAHEAAAIAMKKWIRVFSNRDLGAYEFVEAKGTFPSPNWPERPFEELLEVAFKDQFINTLDHPVLRRLRGDL